MTIFGISVILILGITNGILILFQLLSGLHVLKFKVRVHRAVGITLFISGSLHATLALLMR